MEKRTSLYERHIAAGGRMVPFAGYDMPVQYESGVIAEHKAVRNAAGLFDVSHMGEFTLIGDKTLGFLQQLLCNDFADMPALSCRYSPMLNDDGGTVDDLIVYKVAESRYMLVVNASNRQKDWDWISSRLPGEVEMRDESDDLAELALQGPKAASILGRLASNADDLPREYYAFTIGAVVGGISCIVSRTGYTGEDGFELYCANDDAPRLWDALLSVGMPDGLIPCGLGARDTLRLEAAMPLYGHELTDAISPIEAGLGSFVKMDKADFVGRDALARRGEPARRRRGLKVTGRGIAREDCEIYDGNALIGEVTSGTLLPTAGYAGAMALVDARYKKAGTAVEVDIRGRRVSAEIVKLPFYKKYREVIV